MKLSRFFKNKNIVITQAPHGVLQNGRSMDMVNYQSYDLFAPVDGKVERVYKTGGFHFVFDYGKKCDIIFHHGLAPRAGRFKKGQKIGTWRGFVPAHIHTAIKVDGKWDLLLNYMDRSIDLLPERGAPENKWTRWPTYPDKSISKSKPEYEMVDIKVGKTNRIHIPLIVNTGVLNVRKEPNAQPTTKIVGKLKRGDEISSYRFADGQRIDGNKTWVYVFRLKGYASARLLREKKSK